MKILRACDSAVGKNYDGFELCRKKLKKFKCAHFLFVLTLYLCYNQSIVKL